MCDLRILDFSIFNFFIFKYSDIGLLCCKITIFIIGITLKLLSLTKYGWNNPNWGRLGLKNPKLHFCAISGSSKIIAYTTFRYMSRCGGRVFYDTAIPGDILIGGSSVGCSSCNNYVNTRVLSQCILLPAQSIGNENESTRISAHVLFWYAIVAWDGTMQWPFGWNKFLVAI